MAARTRRTAGRTAIQLRISLQVHTPTIWRHLLVPGGIELSTLHEIFQIAMGWDNRHLHSFEIGDHVYGEADDEEIDEDSVVFADLIDVGRRFVYLYDFGDSWVHEVIVESIEPVSSGLKYASCLDGQRACPPEDCGGVARFSELLNAVGDPDHDEHDEYVQQVGGGFNPESFDRAATNANLQRLG